MIRLNSKKVLQIHRTVFAVFATTVSILTNAAFVHYFTELKRRGCPCASDWRNSALIALFATLMIAGCMQFAGIIPGTNRVVNYSLAALHVITTFIGLSYMQKLQDIDCQTCTKSPVRFVFNMLVNFSALSYMLVATAIVFETIVLLVIMSQARSWK